MQHDCDCRPKHVPGRGINAQGEVLMACCRCCEKTGACCNGGSCTQETCADCEDAGGLFQGVDTECVSGDCPCDPPADPALCERCVDGAPEVYCPESAPNCCEGVCQSAPCGDPCDDASDCPNYGLACAQVFPDVPYNCCNGYCEPYACYPGTLITLEFIKKAGCTAGFLSGIAEGDPFEVAISGGSLTLCGQTSANNSGAPCLTQWVLSEDCVISNLTFSANGDSTCEACYDFQGWTSCRTDCNGDCV